MEQHPVPQNVTTFQFRLIGDMTIKQFGYLMGGGILAFILYKLPLPIFFTLPLAVLSAVGGFGLAFVPIEERPMDIWVLSFFKSIYSPTQYVWSRLKAEDPRPVAAGQKQASPAASSAAVSSLPSQPNTASQTTIQQSPQPVARQPQTGAAPTRRGDILQNIFLPSATTQSPAILTQTPKRDMFDWLFAFMTPKSKPASSPAAQTTTMPSPSRWTPMSAQQMDFSPPPVVKPAAEVAAAIKDTELKESALEVKVKTLQTELQGKNAAESRIVELQAQMTELLAEREKMNKEMDALRRQATVATVTPLVATAPPVPATNTTTTTQTPRPPSLRSGVSGQANMPTIQIIQPGRAVKVGLPRLTTFTNVVTGIVKDKDKNLLPGVLVTVKDKDGIPLRALKTNRLGQFAASTQLPNGTYLVEIEDPRLRYTFDRAQITLNGTIVPALEIFAKTEKEITRAKLEKELFGNKTN